MADCGRHGMAECGGPWYGIGILWRGMVWQIVARAMVWAYGRLWRVSEVTVYWFPSPTGSMQRGSVGHLHALSFEIQNTDDKSRNTLRFSANSQTSSIQRTAPHVQFISRWKLSKIQKCKYTWAVCWLRGHLPPYKGKDSILYCLHTFAPLKALILLHIADPNKHHTPKTRDSDGIPMFSIFSECTLLIKSRKCWKNTYFQIYIEVETNVMVAWLFDQGLLGAKDPPTSDKTCIDQISGFFWKLDLKIFRDWSRQEIGETIFFSLSDFLHSFKRLISAMHCVCKSSLEAFQSSPLMPINTLMWTITPWQTIGNPGGWVHHIIIVTIHDIRAASGHNQSVAIEKCYDKPNSGARQLRINQFPPLCIPVPHAPAVITWPQKSPGITLRSENYSTFEDCKMKKDFFYISNIKKVKLKINCKAGDHKDSYPLKAFHRGISK